MNSAEVLHATAVSPASLEDRLGSVEKFGLLIFLVGAFIATTRASIAPLVGEWYFDLSAAAVPGAAIGLALTVLYHAQRSDVASASGPTLVWAQLVIVHAAALSILGALNDHLARDITRDAVPYVVIAMFALLGHRSSVWRFAEGAALWTSLLALPIALYGLDLSDVAGRGAVQSEAYRTQGAFGLWPLLLIGLPSQPAGWRSLTAATIPFLILAEQLMFLKRAPTVRVALIILLLLFVAPSLAHARRRGRFWLAAAGVAALFALGMAAWGEIFSTAATSLGDRFQGRGGVSASLFDDNERITEMLAWADSTKDTEWILGRGMGSYFTHVDVADFAQSEVDAQGTFARRNLHIGVCEPVLRGGALFALLYLGGFIMALSRTRVALAAARAGEQNLRSLSGALFLYIYLAFQLTEGAPSTSFYFDLPVVGLALGRLLSIPARTL